MFSFFTKANAQYEKLFFDFKVKNINNDIVDLNDFKGKVVLLVNVASNCGFTKQYTELQILYDKYKEKNFVNFLKPKLTDQSCIQLFSNDAIFYYILRKSSCTKYYFIWSAASKLNQKQFIKEISNSDIIITGGEKNNWDLPLKVKI